MHTLAFTTLWKPTTKACTNGHVADGGYEGRPPLPFSENPKFVFWLWNKNLDCVYLNFSFKIQFKKYQGEVLLWNLSFVRCEWNLYWNALRPRSLPYPQRFLVTRQIWNLSKACEGISPGKKLFGNRIVLFKIISQK